MAKQLGFLVNAELCIGCHTCGMACKNQYHQEIGIVWRQLIPLPAELYPHEERAWFSLACNHCANPPCVVACPTEAISKREDGIVLIDPQRCMGCRYCEWACPYGAPQFDTAAGVMTKCNLCYDYIEAGKPPASVSACQMRVLEFGELDELRTKYGALNDVFPLPDPSLTQPAVVFTPHRDTVHAETGAARVSNEEEI